MEFRLEVYQDCFIVAVDAIFWVRGQFFKLFVRN